MKFLVDENLPRSLPDLLGERGHDSIHVADLGLESAPDSVILEVTRERDAC